MIEVEVKVQVFLKTSEVLQRLQKLGALFIESVEQEDIYFSHPCKDFRKSDEALRLRIEEGKAKLTYKGPKLSHLSKTRLELEAPIEDARRVSEILEKLGFKPLPAIRKKRYHLKLSDLDIYVDEVYGLGVFIELEKTIPEGAFTDIETSLLSLINELFPPCRLERRSYLELLLEKLHI